MYPTSTISFTHAVDAAFLTVHMVCASPYATKTPPSLHSNRTMHPAGLTRCSTAQSQNLHNVHGCSYTGHLTCRFQMDATFSCVPRQSLRNPNDVVMLLHRVTGHSKRCCRLHRGRSGGTPVHQVTPRRFRRRHGLRGRYTESHLVIPRQH